MSQLGGLSLPSGIFQGEEQEFRRIDSLGVVDAELEAELKFRPEAATLLDKGICTYSVTKNGEKLYKYNINDLVVHGGIRTILMKGTVFTMDRTVLTVLFAQLVLALITGFIAYVDKDLHDISLTGLGELADYLAAVVPFVLGLYISMTVERWWTLRTKALAPVYNSMANLCLLIGVLIPDVPRYDELRTQVLKYATCSVDLMVRAAREKGGAEDLVDRGILSEEELEMISSLGQYQRSMVMWPWIQRLLLHACEENKLPWNCFVVMVQQCFAAREGIQTIHTYLRTQIPFAYVHLINLIVNCNNVVASTRSGMGIAIYIKNIESNNGEIRSNDLWGIVSSVMTLFAVPVVYHGLLAISYVVQDPFGEEILDFPINAFSNYVFDACTAVYAAKKCPADALFPNSARLLDAQGERQFGSQEKWLAEKARRAEDQEASEQMTRMATSSMALDAENGINAAGKRVKTVEERIDSDNVRSALTQLTQKISGIKTKLTNIHVN